MANTKISDLPEYDVAAEAPDDFFAIVQGETTKQISLGLIKSNQYGEGHLSPTPTAAQFEAIFGIPPINANVFCKDMTGSGGMYWVFYKADMNTWFYRKMTEAA